MNLLNLVGGERITDVLSVSPRLHHVVALWSRVSLRYEGLARAREVRDLHHRLFASAQ